MGQVGMFGGIPRESISPLRLQMLTARQGLAKMGERFGWNIEERLHRPAQVYFRQLNILHAQRRTVRFKGVLLWGTET